jgi:hypothetical protein
VAENLELRGKSMMKYRQRQQLIHRLTSTNSFIILVLISFLVLPGIVQAEVLWSSSHETGDLSDWLIDQSGAVYNTGGNDAKVSVVDEVAHSGKYAVKMEVWGIDKSLRACRIFRWAEHLTEGYYSCWLMFPTLPTVRGWLNIFQFKKKNYSTGAVDPTWYNEVKNKTQGTVLTLTHWEQEWDIPPNQSPSLSLEAGEWFHIEWHYKNGSNNGEIEIWINGDRVWSIQNAETMGIGPDIQWAPSLYGINVTPAHLVMYMDDAVINTERVGPNYFDNGKEDTPPLPPENLRATTE